MKKLINTLYSSALVLMLVSAAPLVQSAQVETAYTTYSRYSTGGQLLGSFSSKPGVNNGYQAVRNTYNNSGLIEKVEKGELGSWPGEADPSGWSSFDVTSTKTTTYDSYGRAQTETVKDKGNIVLSLVEYSYDANSRVLCKAVRMNLMATGNACTSSNVSGDNPDRISRFTYDVLDQVTTEERAVGTSIQENYVSNVYEGRALRYQVDANCNKTELRYDSQWRLSKMVYPATAKVLAAGQTCNKPSEANVLPANAGSVNESDYVEFGYDNNGNKTYERKRSGAAINYTIDNNNRVIFKDYVNTAMQDISYNYDLRGLQLSAKFLSDSGKGITNIYDGFGNLASSNNGMFDTPLTLNYAYDLNNNRTNITHPDGVTFAYGFDGLNRLNSVVDSSSSTLLSITYQSNGRRANLNRTNNTNTSYTFENGVQLKSFEQTFSNNTTSNLKNNFTYNNAGQIASLTLSNSSYYYNGNENRTGAYVSDGLNRYKTVGSAALGYDGNSNLKYDGMTYYNYDDENRLTSMSKLDDLTFTPSFVYDPNGRLFQTTINGTITKFLYDGDALIGEYSGNTGELLRRYVHGDQVDEPLVQYNGSSTAKTNGTIALSTLTAASATFVGNHVLATNTTGYTGATGFIDFVGEGEAKWSLNVATTSTYVITARYALNGPNRPLAVMVDGVQKAILSFPDTKNWNTWSTVKVSVPLSAGSHILSLKTKGSSGPNVDYVTVNAQSGTGIYYLHADHQGSVIAQSDATGKVTSALAYDSYGIPAAANADGFGYTGQLWLKEVGLDYYKARMYSPTLGRFLQTDPIGYKDQMNLYAYVGNDPVNMFDPTGMTGDCPMADCRPTPPPLPCPCDAGNIIVEGIKGAFGNSSKNESTEPGATDNLPVVDEGSAEPSSDTLPQSPGSNGSTKHGEERAQEAKTDPNRQVGDGNKVIENGKTYNDTETGNTVHVDGNRVVIVNEKGERVTQFKNTKSNTSDRIRSGRWEPR